MQLQFWLQEYVYKRQVERVERLCRQDQLRAEKEASSARAILQTVTHQPVINEISSNLVTKNRR